MKIQDEIEAEIAELIVNISNSKLPEGLVDALERLCLKYSDAPQITYSYFIKENDIETKHLIATVLVDFMKDDKLIYDFLVSRGWTKDDFNDL